MQLSSPSSAPPHRLSLEQVRCKCNAPGSGVQFCLARSDTFCTLTPDTPAAARFMQLNPLPGATHTRHTLTAFAILVPLATDLRLEIMKSNFNPIWKLRNWWCGRHFFWAEPGSAKWLALSLTRRLKIVSVFNFNSRWRGQSFSLSGWMKVARK